METVKSVQVRGSEPSDGETFAMIHAEEHLNEIECDSPSHDQYLTKLSCSMMPEPLSTLQL